MRSVPLPIFVSAPGAVSTMWLPASRFTVKPFVSMRPPPFPRVIVRSVVVTFALACRIALLSISTPAGLRPSAPSPFTRTVRHLGLGFAIGVVAALLVTLLPCIFRLAEFQARPETPFQFASLLFVSILLLFGAVGEEILFRGYGFQVIAGTFGAYQSLLPISVVFAAAHWNAPPLGLFNTFLWGVILGFAFLRSGDLWLPIGLHFGWNVTLPLMGVQLSGFTMGLTGYGLVWKISDLWSGGAYGPEGGLLTSLVIPLVFFAIYRAPLERQTPFLMPEKD